MPAAESKQEMEERLGAAQRRIFDALRCVRGPAAPGQEAELIYIAEKALHIAHHLARAGCDVDPQRAIIKARPIKDRFGQASGMVDWVPLDWPDAPPDAPAPISATADVDCDAFDDALPWHVRTRIEGRFQ